MKNKKLALLVLSFIIVIVLAILAINFNYLGKNVQPQPLQPASKADQKYIQYASSHFAIPLFNSDMNEYIAEGIYYNFGSNSIDVVTANGIENFLVNSSTTLQALKGQSQTGTEKGGVLETTNTYTLDSFNKEVPKYSYLQIFYTTSGNTKTANTINYFPDNKLNL